MAKRIISEGKTTAEAVEKGLKELKVSKDMVEIKPIEDGEKRSFYSILEPRIVKVELTVKEGATPRRERRTPEHTANHSERNAPEHTTSHLEKRPTNHNAEEIKEAAGNIREFLDKFLKAGVKYEVKIEDDEVCININGENVNHLIGYRGETINSLQTIISAVANKNTTAKVRIHLDVAGYREKRIKTLEDLAEKIAATVIRTGRSISLEPMTSYERKVIHSKLQTNPQVKTFSKGEEPYRKVIIAPSDQN